MARDASVAGRHTRRRPRRRGPAEAAQTGERGADAKRFNAKVRRDVEAFSVMSQADGSMRVTVFLVDGVQPLGVLDRMALADMVEARLNAALREPRP
jgi:hypothetical protein